MKQTRSFYEATVDSIFDAMTHLQEQMKIMVTKLIDQGPVLPDLENCRRQGMVSEVEQEKTHDQKLF